jgi:hypothetical protein
LQRQEPSPVHPERQNTTRQKKQKAVKSPGRKPPK